MYDRTRLDWRVPAEEWTHFRDFVADEHGSLGGYLGREAENAMQEYIDADGYGRIEERVNELVQAAGRSPRTVFKEKKDEYGCDKSRVTVKVEEDVKHEFRDFVADSDHCLGVEFANAIRAYRQGGRSERMEEKLDRIFADVKDVLGELNTADDSKSGSLSKKQKKVIAICDRVGEEFTDDELVEAIDEIAGRSDRASQPTREEYRDVIVDRLNVEPHPKSRDLIWIPSEKAEKLAGEGTPRECRQPVETLNRGERVRRVQLAVGHEAAKRQSGKYSASLATIRDKVLDASVAKATVSDLLREAANVDGFEVVNGAQMALHVDLGILQDVDLDLQQEILLYRDADGDGLFGSSTDAQVSDFVQGSTHVNEGQEDVLFAVPDGGTEASEGDDEF